MADGWDNIIIGMKVFFAEINTFVAFLCLLSLSLICFCPKGWGGKFWRRPYPWRFQHCFLGCNCPPHPGIQGLLTFHKSTSCSICPLLYCLEMNEFAAGASALWRLWPRWYKRLLDEPLQWKGVAITYKKSYQKQSQLFSYPQVHPVGWCATKGKPLIPPKSIQVASLFFLHTRMNCWILRPNITTGKSSSWKDWPGLAPCPQHSTRYPNLVLNFYLVWRVKTLPIKWSCLTCSKFFCLPGCLGKCFQLFQEGDEVGGGRQDEDQPGNCIS